MWFKYRQIRTFYLKFILEKIFEALLLLSICLAMNGKWYSTNIIGSKFRRIIIHRVVHVQEKKPKFISNQEF